MSHPDGGSEGPGAPSKPGHFPNPDVEGVLFNAPASWLHELILSLNAQDRLYLFRVCRQLARQVVRSTPRILLKLYDVHEWIFQAGEENHAVMARILDEGRLFAVRACNPCFKRFAPVLSAGVCELDLSWDRYASKECESDRGPDWSLLTNLHTVSFEDSTYKLQEVLVPFVEAFEAGHFKLLTSLKLRTDTHLRPEPVFKAGLWERLARASGPQLTCLNANVDALVQDLPHFMALQRLELRSCRIWDGPVAQWLFEHPTLRDVTLTSCKMSGDFRHYACRWNRLSIKSSTVPTILETFPLAGVGEVKLLGLTASWSKKDHYDVLKQNLLKYSSKMELVPYLNKNDGTTSLFLSTPYVELLPLLRLIRQSCRVDICHAPKGFVPALWRALPPCVWGVSLDGCKDVEEVSLWQGLPETVHSLCLLSDTCDSLLALVPTVPAHVRNLKVKKAHKDRLAATAPAHLTIEAKSDF